MLLIIGLITAACLAFVSLRIADRWENLLLCGLIGVAIYTAIPAVYVAIFIDSNPNFLAQFGVCGAALSFFTVVIPVLALDYQRFKGHA
jgi:hypothetical protein